jgi:hypothetical protein
MVEVLAYDEIWFLGLEAQKIPATCKRENNHGKQQNSKIDYLVGLCAVQDHLIQFTPVNYLSLMTHGFNDILSVCALRDWLVRLEYNLLRML